MLYTRCSFCSAIGPLVCAGILFPHPPVPAVQIPGGAACPGCGGVMTGFLCPNCLRPQYLLLPGGPAPAALGPGHGLAPVVQAEQGTSGSGLQRLFEDLAGSLGREFGTAVVQAAFGNQSSWGDPGGQQSSWGQW